MFAFVGDRPAYREGSQSCINTKKFVSERYKMRVRYFKAFMLFGILLASALAFPASYGQGGVVLNLDKRVHTVEESVVIQGIVQSPNNIPVIVQVWNPNNEACSFQQINVDDDGSFTASPILLSGRTCGMAGTYTIKAFYGEFDGSTTFEVQLPTASAKAGNGRLQTLLDILNRARQNVDNKIADLQGKGIDIPDEVNAMYKGGLAELELAKQAVKADDTNSANEHIKNAMKTSRKVFAELTVLEQGETETPSAVSKAVQEDLEKAEEISRLKQAIAQAVEFKKKLKKIAEASAVEANIADFDKNFDKTIAEALALADKGDVEAAAKSLAKARQILADIQKSLMENAQKQRLDKAKEFVAKTIERIDSMIVDAKALDLSQEVIDALEAAKQKILNAKTVNEILEISRELKDKQEQLSGQKGKNFEKALEHLKSKLRETKTKAEQIGLDLNVFDRIQGLIDDAVAKWESGETKNAVDTLEKSEEILREVDGILDHISDKLQELDRLEEAADELKQNYKDNPEVLNAIEKALRLITGARETLQSAMSKKDLRIAEDMTQQAKNILGRVKHSVETEKGGSDVNAAPVKEGQADAIMKEIHALEALAADLKSKAGGNDDALDEIEEALSDIKDAKESVREGKLDVAKGKVGDAKQHLRKAKQIIEQGEDQTEGKTGKDREKEKGKNRSG